MKIKVLSNVLIPAPGKEMPQLLPMCMETADPRSVIPEEAAAIHVERDEDVFIVEEGSTNQAANQPSAEVNREEDLESLLETLHRPSTSTGKKGKCVFTKHLPKQTPLQHSVNNEDLLETLHRRSTPACGKGKGAFSKHFGKQTPLPHSVHNDDDAFSAISLTPGRFVPDYDSADDFEQCGSEKSDSDGMNADKKIRETVKYFKNRYAWAVKEKRNMKRKLDEVNKKAKAYEEKLKSIEREEQLTSRMIKRLNVKFK